MHTFRWVIGIVLLIFGVLGSIGSIMAVIKPKNEQDKANSKSAIIGGLVIAAIGWFIIPSSSSTAVESTSSPSQQAAGPNSETKDIKDKSTQNEKNDAEKTAYSIGMNPEQFKVSFNQQAQAFGASFRINSLEIDEGPVQNSFKYMLNDHLGLVGSINKKDGSIRDVMLLGQGDGTLKSGLDILGGMGALIAATNPSLPPEERGQILKDLGITKGADLSNVDKSTVRNGLKYTLSSSKDIGIMFGVSNANDSGK
ncbi:hypothetical protein DNHGIG_14700 [Collibacillus ludicampi]|uniref:Uncharacterized protein n=1 Tax=Collibacillus ludicampi TaxID=2771369 RepID=A0AAV4LDP2_9BACL|nr:hypothetical protein [Collibacillus ludicampi]GIM45921.1 hypothetical protein DNHGIG_14700 [Collibacillus ludicampi]